MKGLLTMLASLASLASATVVVIERPLTLYSTVSPKLRIQTELPAFAGTGIVIRMSAFGLACTRTALISRSMCKYLLIQTNMRYLIGSFGFSQILITTFISKFQCFLIDRVNSFRSMFFILVSVARHLGIEHRA